MKKLFACLVAALATPAANAADLTIEVLGTQARGMVYVALYNQAGSWMKTPLKGQVATAEPGKTIIVLKDLPEGEYALSLFQDLDGDRRMARNMMGMPTEPWGFSKDALGSFGPPSFEDAKIHLPAAGVSTTVNLRS